MKKVYVLLVALLMGTAAMVQASPVENKVATTNTVAASASNIAAYGTQQVHRKPIHHKRHHRRHRRPHRVVHH